MQCSIILRKFFISALFIFFISFVFFPLISFSKTHCLFKTTPHSCCGDEHGCSNKLISQCDCQMNSSKTLPFSFSKFSVSELKEAQSLLDNKLFTSLLYTEFPQERFFKTSYRSPPLFLQTQTFLC